LDQHGKTLQGTPRTDSISSPICDLLIIFMMFILDCNMLEKNLSGKRLISSFGAEPRGRLSYAAIDLGPEAGGWSASSATPTQPPALFSPVPPKSSFFVPFVRQLSYVPSNFVLQAVRHNRSDSDGSSCCFRFSNACTCRSPLFFMGDACIGRCCGAGDRCCVMIAFWIVVCNTQAAETGLTRQLVAYQHEKSQEQVAQQHGTVPVVGRTLSCRMCRYPAHRRPPALARARCRRIATRRSKYIRGTSEMSSLAPGAHG